MSFISRIRAAMSPPPQTPPSSGNPANGAPPPGQPTSTTYYASGFQGNPGPSPRSNPSSGGGPRTVTIRRRTLITGALATVAGTAVVTRTVTEIEDARKFASDLPGNLAKDFPKVPTYPTIGGAPANPQSSAAPSNPAVSAAPSTPPANSIEVQNAAIGFEAALKSEWNIISSSYAGRLPSDPNVAQAYQALQESATKGLASQPPSLIPSLGYFDGYAQAMANAGITESLALRGERAFRCQEELNYANATGSGIATANTDLANARQALTHF